MRCSMTSILFYVALAPFACSSVAARSDSVWWDRVVVLELTGNGQLDSLRLFAVGQRPESLTVTFAISERGKTLYTLSWPSYLYFAYDHPIDSIPRVRLAQRVQKHFDEFFDADAFRMAVPGDSSQAFEILPYQLCPDTAALSVTRSSCPDTLIRSVWEDILRGRPKSFTFFSGGEIIRTIVWSSRMHRFLEVFACC